MTEVFPFSNDAKVTYMNNVTGEKWNKWEKWEYCSKEEKKKINLASIPEDYILFDKDLPTEDNKIILEEYETFKKILAKKHINSYLSWLSVHGFHVLAKFEGLSGLDENVRKEIRKFYISLLNCDPAKVSARGVIALPNKPHFKNNVVYGVLDNIEGLNNINAQVIQQATKKVKEIETLLSNKIDTTDFKDYFEKDPFFNFIKNNIIPENTSRDLTLFPNLAIACFKSGKTLQEIREIIEPIILKNFPGKIYAEFEGWLKKATSGEIQTYNQFQLNTWTKDIFDKEFYDLKPLKVEETVENVAAEKKIEDSLNVYWDKDLNKLENIHTKWVVQSWIPQGDICFIAGKASSFKTVMTIHMGYAIATGGLVFNKYETIKNKVLYLNEENPRNVLLNFINRIKKGLGIEEVENIGFSIMENLRIDKAEDILKITDYVKKNNIKVLVLDSFRRFIGFDENNATEMNKLFNNLKYIRNMCGGDLTIIVLHHLKKDNGGYSNDLRDMLRGSSDIVNSSDSIIGIKRKHGSRAIRIEHVKNRSGEEIIDKIINIDMGEQNDRFYLYETNAESLPGTKGLEETCADEIVEYVKEKNLTVFGSLDLKEIRDKYSQATFSRAMESLKTSGDIYPASETKGKYAKYMLVE